MASGSSARSRWNSADAGRTVGEGGHYLLKAEKTPPSSSMISSSGSATTPPSPTKAGRSTSVTAAAGRLAAGS
jgi:hypothetical protein